MDQAPNHRTEIAVIGGGLVGGAIAYGLLRNGHGVTIFDEGDKAFRASRGNFGLVWVQGKGDTLPAYAKWTRRSASLWQGFADDLKETSGIDVQLQQKGGLFYCLTDEELSERKKMLEKMRDDLGGDYPFDVLDHKALKEMVPEIGPTVAGATWGPEDGHVNPLKTMHALASSFQARNGKTVNGQAITQIEKTQSGFQFKVGNDLWYSDKIVLAAGLGNKDLSAQVGIHAPVFPNRGQVLITERVAPFMKYPSGHVRQTDEGTIQCGDSKEDVGLNVGTTVEELAKIAKRAVTLFPLLENIRMVRSWGALRIMTEDGYPIYAQSEECPGAYVVCCHSGVTLAAAHAGPLVDWISKGQQIENLEDFHGERFTLS